MKLRNFSILILMLQGILSQSGCLWPESDELLTSLIFWKNNTSPEVCIGVISVLVPRYFVYQHKPKNDSEYYFQFNQYIDFMYYSECYIPEKNPNKPTNIDSLPNEMKKKYFQKDQDIITEELITSVSEYIAIIRYATSKNSRIGRMSMYVDFEYKTPLEILSYEILITEKLGTFWLSFDCKDRTIELLNRTDDNNKWETSRRDFYVIGGREMFDQFLELRTKVSLGFEREMIERILIEETVRNIQANPLKKTANGRMMARQNEGARDQGTRSESDKEKDEESKRSHSGLLICIIITLVSALVAIICLAISIVIVVKRKLKTGYYKKHRSAKNKKDK